MQTAGPPQTVDKLVRAKSKVKTGCQTCKGRKVKCDEGFPACHRCLSTGRRCAGYGIWGGGGGDDNASNKTKTSSKTKNSDKTNSTKTNKTNSTKTNNSSTKAISPPLPRCTSTLVPSYEYIAVVSAPARTPRVLPLGATPIEVENFRWLGSHSVHKLPGSCPSSFWSHLLLQASVTDPAVWHAAVAMGSFHRAATLPAAGCEHDVMRKAEAVAVGHYVRAIRFLQPHFESDDGSSVRTTLIACIMFLCLELLRGDGVAARVHLLNGLRILGRNQAIEGSTSGSSPFSDGGQGSRSLIDDQIEETLLRFKDQLDMYDLLNYHRVPAPSLRVPIHPPETFQSLKEAWVVLSSLSNRIITLRGSALEAEFPGNNPSTTCGLQSSHSTLVEALDHWFKIYTLSKPGLVPGGQPGYLRAYNVLLMHHPMIDILLQTALSADEMEYDWHNAKFLAILTHVIDLWTMGGEHPALEGSQTTSRPGSRSMLDVGCIPPLYFTAVKCRVHRVRLQAIRVLEAAGHREGFWDAGEAARAGRRVMEAEEGDFYAGLDMGDDFALESYPRAEDLSLPLIPACRRIHVTVDESWKRSREVLDTDSMLSSEGARLLLTP